MDAQLLAKREQNKYQVSYRGICQTENGEWKTNNTTDSAPLPFTKYFINVSIWEWK